MIGLKSLKKVSNRIGLYKSDNRKWCAIEWSLISHVVKRQNPDWPTFHCYAVSLEPYEQQFLLSSGEFLGVVHHVNTSDRPAKQ